MEMPRKATFTVRKPADYLNIGLAAACCERDKRNELINKKPYHFNEVKGEY